MLRNLASGKHVGLIRSEEDLSCLYLELSSLFDKPLRLRAKSDKAEPENAATDLDVEPVRLGPGHEGRLRVGYLVLACPSVVLRPPIVLRQGDEVSTRIEETLVPSLAVSASCGPGCDLLLIAVCDNSTKQRSDDGDGRRNDPRHIGHLIIRQAGQIEHESATTPRIQVSLAPFAVRYRRVRGGLGQSSMRPVKVR
ncbi:hypothetical protein GA0115261_108541 [Streptomyces sp. OspMP-M43]|nr:hypothetical protein GA0115261_108541 [Streptomyces sp. OspMP-M43]